VFIIVESGLKEGDEVVLNPLAYIDETQDEALKPFDEVESVAWESREPAAGPSGSSQSDSTSAAAGSQLSDPGSDETSTLENDSTDG
jgi:hypothetical protein